MNPSFPITLDYVTSLHSSLRSLDPSFPQPFPAQDSSSLQLYLTSACTHLVQLLEEKQEQPGLNKLVRTLQAERRSLEEENEELREELERLQRDSEDEETENGDNLTRLLMVNVLKKTLESKELTFEQKEREMKQTIGEKEEEIRSVAAALALETARHVKPLGCDVALQTLSTPVKDSEMQIYAVKVHPQETQTQAIGESKDCQTDSGPEKAHREIQTLSGLRQIERGLGGISIQTQMDYVGECGQKEVQTDWNLGNIEEETQTYPLAEYCCREMQTESGGKPLQAEVQATAVSESVDTQVELLETKEIGAQTNPNILQIHPKTIDFTLKREKVARTSTEMQTESPVLAWEPAVPDPTLCATEAYVQTQLDLESQWIQTEATEEKEALVQTSLDLADFVQLIVPETATIGLQTAVSIWKQGDVEVQVRPSTTAQRSGSDRDSLMQFEATQTELKGENRWTQTVAAARRNAEMQFRPCGVDKETEADISRERAYLEALPARLVSPKQAQKSFLLLKPTPKATRNSAAQTPSQDSKSAFSLQSIAVPARPSFPTKQAAQWTTSLPLSPKDPEFSLPMGTSPRGAEERFPMPQKALNKSESSELSAWEAQLQAKESTLLGLTQQLRQRERVTLEREQRQRRRKLFEAGAVTQLYPVVQRRETEKSLTDR